MNAWAGKILVVDLTARKSICVPTSDYSDTWLGGKGIDLALLLAAECWQADPLSPENILVFGTGPLTGTLAPAASRVHVGARSPATELCGSSNIGGQFGPELKYAGYDHLVIKGAAAEPAVLVIDDDRVKIQPAQELWGLGVSKTEAALAERYGSDFRFFIIGPGGENRVRFAGIRSGTFNSASRTGMGAVMGSKNLKAIAVRGSKAILVARPERFYAACQRARREILESPCYQNMLNVPQMLRGSTHTGYFSYGNKESIVTPIEETISKAEDFLAAHRVGKAACFSCPLRCQDVFDVPGSGRLGMQCDPRVEFNYMAQVDDPTFAWRAYVICQETGLDTTSIANVLGFVNESLKVGDLSWKELKKDLNVSGEDRVELFLALITAISERKGIGDLLAEGVARAGKKLGPSFEQRAMHRDGLELAVPEPRTHLGLALAYSVSERGDYLSGFPIFEMVGGEAGRAMAAEAFGDGQIANNAADRKTLSDKEYVQTYMENMAATADMLGVCRWMTPTNGAPIKEDTLAELLTEAVGKTYTGEDLWAYADRCRKAFFEFDGKCRREKEKQLLPERLFHPVSSDQGQVAGIKKEELIAAISRYKKLRRVL
ncbi:MAG: hypothetical protein GX489_05465 [Firmicutes bacterium]|nr:hypothetical protein [Bacillota bacterium]